MSNTPTNPNPHNLPAALARAQRPVVDLSTLGIDAFEPAKPGVPGVKPAPVVDPAIPGTDRTVVTSHPIPGAHTARVNNGENVGNFDPALFVYIATFAIKQGVAHKNIKVEVPCTGSPQGDKAAAWAEIRRQCPTVPKNGIVRTSEKVSPRAGTGAQSIQFSEGMTVRQLFPDRTEFEAARLVGRISFESEPHDVILRHIRAKSVFSLTLKPLKGPATINFSEQVSVMRLATELPAIINQLLGDAGKNLELYFTK